MTDRAIDHDDLLQITSDIVSAHVSNNPVPLGELPGLIQTVYSTLTGLSAPAFEPTGRADARRQSEEVGDRRLHRLPRGRKEAEDAEAPPFNGL